MVPFVSAAAYFEMVRLNFPNTKLWHRSEFYQAETCSYLLRLSQVIFVPGIRTEKTFMPGSFCLVLIPLYISNVAWPISGAYHSQPASIPPESLPVIE